MKPSSRSSAASQPKIDPFAERVDMLLEELSFSIQAGRPSILFAPYGSIYVQALVDRLLAERLQPLGQKILPFSVSEDEYDVPLTLSRHPGRQTAVFSVLRLAQGGGKYGANAFRALNIRRELLVDHHIRAVFWLTSDESRQLSRHAPDFWAFRHRVIEFNRPSDINQLTYEGVKPPLTLLREARQAAHLAPENASSWWTLGERCLEFGLLAPARRAFLRGLSLEPRQAGGWLGLGSVYRLGQNYSDAIINYRQAIGLDPQDLSAYIALIACQRLLGQEALADESVKLAWPLAEEGSEVQQAALAAVCGDVSRAVERLRTALKKDLIRLDQLERDPNMDLIRNDPAFLQLFTGPQKGNPGGMSVQ
jgi:hypothetical protein